MVRRPAHFAAHLGPDPAAVGRFSVIGETWAQIVDRVSSALCRRPSERQEIRTAMQSAELVPAGQILRWAGRPKGLLYNCFVTEADPGEDAQDVAARFTGWTALGAGVGANVSAWCRARGTEVQRLREIVDTVAHSQQLLWDTGVTRTATMLNVDFQLSGAVDVCAELSANPTYRHLNMGVVISDRAMREAVEARQLQEWNSAREELERLAAVAWRTGNPGLIFKDAVNQGHPFKEVLEACNPCAEQHLRPGEGCNLASINLAAFISESGFDLSRFRDVVRAGVRMLDATIDASEFPTKEAARLAASRRRIGLGVTGFDSALQALGIGYDSEDAVACAEQWALELAATAQAESESLAAGASAFDGHDDAKRGRARHSYLMSIAPAGAISLLWGISSGIEPIFAPRYRKGAFDVCTNESRAQHAYDIPAHQHVRIAATWQRHIDGGISKTVNLPAHATVDDVIEIFIDAWLQGCKGISLFRDGSRTPALVIGTSYQHSRVMRSTS